MRRSPSLSSPDWSPALRRKRRTESIGSFSTGSDEFTPLTRSASSFGGRYHSQATEGTRLLAPLKTKDQSNQEYGRDHEFLKPPYIAQQSSTSSTSSKEFLGQNNEQEVATVALVQWIVPALICALAYALYNIFIKKGSSSIHPILGGVILQFVAALIGLVLCLTLAYGPSQQEMFYDGNGILFAALAGVSVGIAEIVSFTVSGMGVQATQSIPIIIGGSVFFGTLLGKLFLDEDLSLSGWGGVCMIAGGIALVARDGHDM